MLSVPNYALYEVHANGEERRLNADEKPLLVQLNWHIDDREGRFLLKNIDQKTTVSGGQQSQLENSVSTLTLFLPFSLSAAHRAIGFEFQA